MVRQGDEYDPGLVLLDEVIWASMSDEQRERYLIEIGAIPPDPFPEPSVGLFQQVTPDDLYAAVPDTDSSLIPQDSYTATVIPIPRDYGQERLTPAPNRAARRKAARRR